MASESAEIFHGSVTCSVTVSNFYQKLLFLSTGTLFVLRREQLASIICVAADHQAWCW